MGRRYRRDPHRGNPKRAWRTREVCLPVTRRQIAIFFQSPDRNFSVMIPDSSTT